MTEEGKKVSSRRSRRTPEKSTTKPDQVKKAKKTVEEKVLEVPKAQQKSKVIELGSIVVMPNGKKGKIIEAREDNNFIIENTEDNKKSYKYIYNKLELKLV